MAEDLHKQIKIDADVGERQRTYYLELWNKDAIRLLIFLYMHLRLFYVVYFNLH